MHVSVSKPFVSVCLPRCQAERFSSSFLFMAAESSEESLSDTDIPHPQAANENRVTQ